MPPIEPIINNNPFEPLFIFEEITEPSSVMYEVQKVMLPIYDNDTSAEELKSSPEIKALQAAVMNGKVLEIIINHPEDILAYPEQ